MNQIGLRFRDPDPASGSPRGEALDLDRLTSALRRQVVPILVSAAACLCLGVAYLATTPSTYTTGATVLADTLGNRMVEEVAAFEVRVQDDAALLNEFEVIRSQEIARAVAEELRLHENDAFLNPPSSLLSEMVAGAKAAVKAALPLGAADLPVRPAADATPEEIERAEIDAAARTLQRDVIVNRYGRSFAFAIGYASHDPALAADIANAYARAYLSDELNANFQATERTTAWLQDRLAELEAASREAAQTVEAFRNANGLAASDGQLITEQSLTQINTERAAAVAAAAGARALASQYQAVRDAGPGEGLAQRVLGLDSTDDVRLTEIQTRLSALSVRLGQIEADFGADHPQARRVRAELAEESTAAYREVERLAERFASDAAAAAAREAALRESVAAATTVNAEAGALQVELRALEQRSEALATLYQSYLTRFEEIDQQKSFPVSSVRILSEAEVPRSPSAPGITRTLGAFLVLGLLVGAAVAFLREHRDRFFRTREDVLRETGLPFLGYLPDYSRPPREALLKRLLKRPEPIAGLLSAPSDRIRLYGVENPRSHFAETLRTVRHAIEVAQPGKRHRVIGVTSALPREGKSTVALNLAGHLASTGRSTLLIDADLREMGLTRLVGPKGKVGLVDALLGTAKWRNVRVMLGDANFHFLPSVAPAPLAHTSDLLASAAAETILDEAREGYDYVILDLPPLGPVIDARAVLPLLDTLVLVAEWGRTPRGILRGILEADPLLAAKSVGVALNKVDVEALGDYGTPEGAERYLRDYAPYYADAS